jgi:hypothetical protein
VLSETSHPWEKDVSKKPTPYELTLTERRDLFALLPCSHQAQIQVLGFVEAIIKDRITQALSIVAKGLRE